MIANLPRELAANIFDHLGSCAAGAAAAQTCRALNDAWYDSRHWSSEPLTIPILSNKNAPDVVRALSKTGWSVRFLVIGVATASVEIIADIVRRLEGLESLYILFANPRHVDATPIVKAFSSKIKSLWLHANTSWSIANGVRMPDSIKTYSSARQSNSIFGADLPRNLETLEIIDCESSIVLYKNPPPELRSLSIRDRHDAVIVPLDRFPNLERLSIKNASIVVRYADQNAVHVISTEIDLEYLRMVPLNAVAHYAGRTARFPEGVYALHMMPSGRRHYPMNVQGINAFVVDRASTYDICLVDETSMMIMRRF